MNFDEKLDRLLSRYDELTNLMSENYSGSSNKFVRLSKEYAELKPIVQCIEERRDLKKEIAELNLIVSDNQTETEIRNLADLEIKAAKELFPKIDRRLHTMLMPKDSADEKNAILEVRAGTGGDEAALFAGDLFKMYQRYAERNNWKFETIQLSETGIGGLKEAIVEVKGKGVFARLKFESGVHRVQRVPETESSGRIHTSAATVAVLPEAEEADVIIDEKDLRVDTFRAQGAGGQHVNTTDSAVRITHLPSGIVVSQQDEKSQHKNRAKAMKVLRARVFEANRAEKTAERAQTRKDQVGTGDRSERIRTYNFPQSRVTDHRIGLTLHKIDSVLGGEALNEIIEALTTSDEANRLSEIHQK